MPASLLTFYFSSTLPKTVYSNCSRIEFYCTWSNRSFPIRFVNQSSNPNQSLSVAMHLKIFYLLGWFFFHYHLMWLCVFVLLYHVISQLTYQMFTSHQTQLCQFCDCYLNERNALYSHCNWYLCSSYTIQSLKSHMPWTIDEITKNWTIFEFYCWYFRKLYKKYS